MADEPSNLELQVLAVLWERGALTVRDILGALPDGKSRAYTTVLSILQIMERKGLVIGRKEGTANVYSPVVERKTVLGSLMRRLLQQAFGGRPTAVMQCLLDEADCEPQELAELQRIIEEKSQPSKLKKSSKRKEKS